MKCFAMCLLSGLLANLSRANVNREQEEHPCLQNTRNEFLLPYNW
jgi:hypothetical protein